MSFAILRAMWLGLVRDRGALMMSFVLPAVFFVIMAEIFTATSGGSLNLNVALVDEIRDGTSERLLAALGGTEGIRLLTESADGAALDADRLRRMVRTGDADVGLLLRADAEPLDSAGGFGPAPILIVSDPSRGVTVPMLMGRIREAYFGALPDVAMGNVVDELENQFLTLSDVQRDEVAEGLAEMRSDAAEGREVGWSFEDLLETEEVAGQGDSVNLVAYSAGAVAFMFLLFASVHGAVSLLEERESGLLDRVLAGPGGIGVLVNGKYLYLVAQGIVQVAVIFVVAWLLYDLDLPGHLLPWFVVTVIACLAAASMAMLLASLCQTRRQAQTIANTVILVMSALGGSMVPRIFMPDALREIGWLTPNTWALEAYSGIFWRQDGLAGITEPLLLLLLTGVIGWALAYWFARRRAYGVQPPQRRSSDQPGPADSGTARA